uniref:Putative nonstructral polyprotein n=1 Tax=Riboviria sp. TaxID=2585031 RepID=A0A6M3YTR0_9VIRU|nr:MAG: putative nonstructral polyprotein [Riboviria sp.]
MRSEPKICRDSYISTMISFVKFVFSGLVAAISVVVTHLFTPYPTMSFDDEPTRIPIGIPTDVRRDLYFSSKLIQRKLFLFKKKKRLQRSLRFEIGDGVVEDIDKGLSFLDKTLRKFIAPFLPLWRKIFTNDWKAYYYTSCFVRCLYAIVSTLLYGPVNAYLAYNSYSLVNTLGQTLNNLNSVSGKVDTRIDDLNRNVSSVMNHVNDISSNISDTVGKVKNMIDPLTHAEHPFAILVNNCKKHPFGICSALYSLAKSNSKSVFISNIVTLLSLLGLEEAAISKISDVLSSRCNQTERFEAGDHSKLISGLAFASLISKSLGYSVDKTNFANMLFKFSSEKKKMETLATDIEDIASEFGFDFSDRTKFVKELRADFESIVEETIALESQLYCNGSRFLAPSEFNRVISLKDKLFKIRIRLANQKYEKFISTTMHSEILHIGKKVDVMYTKVQDIRGKNGNRPMPVGVCWLGKSQIGKSHAATYFHSLIKTILYNRFKSNIQLKLDDTLGDDDANLFDWTVFSGAQDYSTWNEQPRDGFDTGYEGQEFHYVDEAFKDTDHLDHPKNLAFMSCTSLGTVQADLASKGRAYNTRLWHGCMNKFPTSSKTLNNFDALVNRYTHFVHVEDLGTARNTTFSHLKFTQGSCAAYVANNGLLPSALPNNENVFNIFDLAQDVADSIINNERVFQMQARGVESIKSDDPRLQSVFDPFVQIVDVYPPLEAYLKNPYNPVREFHEDYIPEELRRSLSCVKVNVPGLDFTRCPSGLYHEVCAVYPQFLQFSTVLNMLCNRQFTLLNKTCEQVRDEDCHRRLKVALQEINAFIDHEHPIVVMENNPRVQLGQSVAYIFWKGKKFVIQRTYRDYMNEDRSFIPREIRNIFAETFPVFTSFYRTPYDVGARLIIWICDYFGWNYDLALVIWSVACPTIMQLAMIYAFIFLIFRSIAVVFKFMLPTLEADSSTDSSDDDSDNEDEEADSPNNSTRPKKQRRNLNEADSPNNSNIPKKQRKVLKEADSPNNSTTPKKQRKFLKECLEVIKPVPAKRKIVEGLASKFTTKLLVYSPPGSGKTFAISELKISHPHLNIGDTDDSISGSFDVVFTNMPELLTKFPSIKICYKESQWNKFCKSKCSDWQPSWFKDSEKFSGSLLNLPGESHFVNRFSKFLIFNTNLQEGTVRDSNMRRKILRRNDVVETLEACADPTMLNVYSKFKSENILSIVFLNSKKIFHENSAVSKARKTPFGHALYGWGCGSCLFSPAHGSSLGQFGIATHISSSPKVGNFLIQCVSRNPRSDLALWEFVSPSSVRALPAHDAFDCSSLSNIIPSFKNFLKFVPSEAKYMDVISSGTGLLHVLRNDIAQAVHFDLYGASTINGEIVGERDLHVIGIKTADTITLPGDCGSPLFVHAPHFVEKLVGMHHIGSSDFSYTRSICVTRERLESLFVASEFTEILPSVNMESLQDDCHLQIGSVTTFNDFLSFEPSFEPSAAFDTTSQFLDTSETANDAFVGDGFVDFIGSLRDPDTNHEIFLDPSGNKHQHHETPFFSAFPVTQIPSVLSADDPRIEDDSDIPLNGNGEKDILLHQTNLYAPHHTNIDMELLSDMVEQLVEYSVNELYDRDLSIAPYPEAILGNKSISPHFEPMNLKSSNGFPYTLAGVMKGTDIYQVIDAEQIEIVDEEAHLFLRAKVEEKLKLANAGKRTLSIWKNCLKSETRPLAKIKKPKTRLFVAAPREITIAFRQLFGKYKAIWTEKRERFWHSVGINPASPDWNNLALSLQNFPNKLDEDFEAFDKREVFEFIQAVGFIICETIRRVSDDGHFVARQVLWDEITHTICASRSSIIMKKNGNPSGNPLTTVLNSWINMMYHWYVFRKVTKRHELSQFNKHVFFRSFGDDVVQAYSNDIASEYNFPSIKQTMLDIGQIVTLGDKTQNFKEKDIYSLQYLKRKFMVSTDDQFWVAPLLTESIEGMFNFSSIADNDVDTWVVAINESLLEASLHGREYYHHFRMSLLQHIRTKEFRTAYPLLYGAASTQLLTSFEFSLQRFKLRYHDFTADALKTKFENSEPNNPKSDTVDSSTEKQIILHFVKNDRFDNFQGFANLVFANSDRRNQRRFKYYHKINKKFFITHLDDGRHVFNIRTTKFDCWADLQSVPASAFSNWNTIIVPKLGTGIYGYSEQRSQEEIRQFSSRIGKTVKVNTSIPFTNPSPPTVIRAAIRDWRRRSN